MFFQRQKNRTRVEHSTNGTGEIPPTPSRRRAAVISSAAIERVASWKGVAFFLILLSIASGITWLYSVYGKAAKDYIIANEMFALPDYAVQTAYFSIIGVVAQKLSMRDTDARREKLDLLMYTGDVLSACLYAPPMSVALLFFSSIFHLQLGEIDISLASATPGFISIISLVLGFYHEKLRTILNRIYKELFEKKKPSPPNPCPLAEKKDDDQDD